MKVLHIINSLATGGAEKLIADTLPLLNEQGITADLLLLNGTHYPFLKELYAKQNCQIFTLGTASVYHPKHILQLIPYLKKYNIVHVHLFPALYWVAIAKILSFSNTKLVFTEHNTNNRRIENKWTQWPEKIIYQQYQKIICITQEVKKIIQKHAKIPDEKLVLIHNGVNLSTLKNAKSIAKNQIIPSLATDDFVLIQIAGFRVQKDQKTLIRSLLHLPKNVKLLLAGNGETLDDCKNLVKKEQLENRVFFLGIRTDVPTLLKSVDVVVLSSHYEGLSLSSIEGMASGKPFIASDVPGLQEIVKNAGILFPKNDDRQLANEIQKLMNDKTHYQNTVQNCQERALQYDIQKMINQTIALYKTL